MKRRDFVKALGGLGGGLALGGLAACGQEQKSGAASVASSSQQTFEWKMVTTWPEGFPGLGTGAERLAKLITAMSGGRINVKLYAAGELVPALEVFDAVSGGTVELGHGASYYWKGKAPAAQFFAAVPFGMNAQEMNGWLYYGGGQQLWDKVYAPFNLKPFPAGNTGVQMGGWFNKPINTTRDLQGLRMRIPGLGGEVLKRAGGVPVTLPGGEIFTSLKTGVIDATEWVGPWNDLAFGLHQAAKYYYTPGWHEPGSVLECMVNMDAYNTLPDDLKLVVENACKAINMDMLAEYTARNPAALEALKNEHGVEVREFPAEVLERLRRISEEVVAELAASDPLVAEVHASFRDFQQEAQAWHAVSEEAFYRARRAG
ncbi:MAG: TRAP transporter substrate-binding protein [Gammaproteobacteria bacterium]|nr:TRAP transporter substrate-binding protein [Gammaproteobacteria bacterium]